MRPNPPVVRPFMTGWLVVIALVAVCAKGRADDPVSYNRDIRPLLAKHCLACHGPDEESRQADLRLDTFDGATRDLGGHQAIRPNEPSASELLNRITSQDADVVMPPPKSGPPLSAVDVEKLTKWIQSGATFEQHWAFVPPVERPKPSFDSSVLNDASSRSALDSPTDAWVLAKLQAKGIAANGRAERETLARRIYLDLTGVPPTNEELDTFLQDQRPDATHRLVDRLLASERYGERWGRIWLDLARYSDTNGYEKDRERSIWPYRDWVIDALNQDMPFDQFTIEQIAGDMLPGATDSQRIATGFHRNTMLNEEGGIDPLEYRFYAMVDRVATTGTVWLGMTVGCAQCHSHKFDPISHVDYYRFLALLNNADEPDLSVSDDEIEQRRKTLEQRIAALESQLADQFPAGESLSEEAKADPAQVLESRRRRLNDAFQQWVAQQHEKVAAWSVIRPAKLQSNLPKLEVREDGSIFSSGDITKRDVFTLEFNLDGLLPDGRTITALRLEALPDPTLPANGPGRCYYEGRRGDFFLSELMAEANGSRLAFGEASHSYGKLSIGGGNADAKNVFDGDGSTGWSTSGREGEPSQLVLIMKEPLAAKGSLKIEMLFERHFAASLGRFRLSVTDAPHAVQAHDMPIEVEKLLVSDSSLWKETDREGVLKYFLRVAPELAAAREPIDKLRGRLPDSPRTLVMQQRPSDNPRPTHRHHRGEYLSPKEPVEPGVPAVFTRGDGHQPADRLELARWLVSERNPLAGRVVANRIWQQLFGTGIVAAADFGTQAPPPSHPELLDYLAIEISRHGWSQKHMTRELLCSATYQRDSRVTTEQRAADPANVWLARGPRYRLDGEMVRDAALNAAGLLVQSLGGPSVRPPQPSVVTELAYGNETWKPSTGGDRYRRSLYTYSKRTAPFAAYLTFDAPSGELCVARRDRSNTPLQSLTLLNDEMFLEAARALATRTLQVSDDPMLRARWMLRTVLSRTATDRECEKLVAFVQRQTERFERGELDAKAIIAKDADDRVLAVWTLAARGVLNLDEAITKP